MNKRLARLIAIAFLAVCAPVTVSYWMVQDVSAQAAQSQSTTTIRRDITRLETEREETEKSRVAKSAEQESNNEQQQIARNRGDQDRLGRLKRQGTEIGEELNKINDKLKDLDSQIEEKFRALRRSGRAEVKLNIAAAVTQAAAGNPAAVGDSLKLAHSALTGWEDGAKKWQATPHVQTALRQPPLGENRVVAEAEYTRLQANLIQARSEAELEAEEIADIDTLTAFGVNHDDWQKLKEQLAALRKLLAERKTQLDAMLIRYQNRERELKRYLDRE